jgi:hypothetical protein
MHARLVRLRRVSREVRNAPRVDPDARALAWARRHGFPPARLRGWSRYRGEIVAVALAWHVANGRLASSLGSTLYVARAFGAGPSEVRYLYEMRARHVGECDQLDARALDEFDRILALLDDDRPDPTVARLQLAALQARVFSVGRAAAEHARQVIGRRGRSILGQARAIARAEEGRAA